MRRSLISLTLASLIAASSARAEEPCPPAQVDPTAHRHLGFYLHLDTGVGGMTTSLPDGGRTSGVSAAGNGIAIGGAITENLILSGRLWGMSQQNEYADGRHLGVAGIGPELTAYFMPTNAYLSIAPLLTVNNVKLPWRDDMPGFGALVAVGKEWWVGAHWGLGVAGQGFFSANRDSGERATTFAGRVAFSVTYN